MSDSDKRSNERVTIDKEFESFDAFIQEYVTNISRTGVFIKSSAPLALGTQVNLHFTVVMDGIETIEGIGEVVRVEKDPPGMGVVFRELSMHSKGLLDKLLTLKSRGYGIACVMGQSEVKGLWFVVARRYIVDTYHPEVIQEMAARMDEPLRPAIFDPLRSEWYPEAALQQGLGAFDAVVAKGDPAKILHTFEDCTLQGVHRFFQALLRLTSPDFLLRKTPVLWRYVRRGQGSVSVETDADRAIVRYVDFPYFDDVNYRLLALGTLRPLATLCGGTNPRADVVGFAKDWLTVEITYR